MPRFDEKAAETTLLSAASPTMKLPARPNTGRTVLLLSRMRPTCGAVKAGCAKADAARKKLKIASLIGALRSLPKDCQYLCPAWPYCLRRHPRNVNGQRPDPLPPRPRQQDRCRATCAS